MRHRMSVANSGAGKTYELILETAGVKWQAIWRTLNSEGTPIRGPHGSTVDFDGSALFDRVRKMLEEEDPTVVGVAWTFEKPLAPWMVEAPGP